MRPTISPFYKKLEEGEEEGEEEEEEGEGEEEEKQRNEQEEGQKSIKLISEYHSEHESLEEETSQIQNDDGREIAMAEHTQKEHEQAKANQVRKIRKSKQAPTPKNHAEEESKSQIELGTDTDHEKDDKNEAKSDYLQSPRSKSEDDEMKSARSHKSEAAVISGRTEKHQRNASQEYRHQRYRK